MSRKFADDVELPGRDPSSDNYAARKLYVDNGDAGRVSRNGDTVTGNLGIRDAATPTKSYRCRTNGSALDLEFGGQPLYVSAWTNADFSGTQTNSFSINTNGVVSFTAPVYVLTPTVGGHAVNKDYVDGQVADAAKITTGTINNARLPRVLTPVRAVAPSGGVITIDASGAGNSIESSISAAVSYAVPTNGVDGQVIQGVCYNSGGSAYVVTWPTTGSTFGRLSPIAATISVPTGKHMRYVLRATDISGTLKWLLESVGIES